MNGSLWGQETFNKCLRVKGSKAVSLFLFHKTFLAFSCIFLAKVYVQLGRERKERLGLRSGGREPIFTEKYTYQAFYTHCLT